MLLNINTDCRLDNVLLVSYQHEGQEIVEWIKNYEELPSLAEKVIKRCPELGPYIQHLKKLHSAAGAKTYLPTVEKYKSSRTKNANLESIVVRGENVNISSFKEKKKLHQQLKEEGDEIKMKKEDGKINLKEVTHNIGTLLESFCTLMLDSVDKFSEQINGHVRSTAFSTAKSIQDKLLAVIQKWAFEYVMHTDVFQKNLNKYQVSYLSVALVLPLLSSVEQYQIQSLLSHEQNVEIREQIPCENSSLGKNDFPSSPLNLSTT